MARARMPSAAAMLLVGLAVAVPSRAETASFVKEGSVEVGAKLGGYFFLSDDETLAGNHNTFNYGFHVGYNVTRMFGAELGVDISPAEVNDQTVWHLHFDGIVHPFRHDWFIPFFGAGPSVSTAVLDEGSDDSDPAINGLVGIKLYPWEHVGLRVDTRYIARFGTSGGEDAEHDLIVSGGIFGTFGGKDPIGDRDGDGIRDPDDACPDTPGPESTEGCPDADDDGVRDEEDDCPEVPGVPKHDGCPDSDGDGIVDAEDRCPEVPGVQKYDGCADRDEDGIADPDDRCPDIPGTRDHGGCPPPPPDEVVEKYQGTMEGITFEFDSATIQPSAEPVLDEAVKALKKYPQLVIKVEGHTSVEGGYEHNMELARARAEAVKSYLVDNGIDEARIETEGLGPEEPVAPNDTEAGRERNRRIEFEILRQ